MPDPLPGCLTGGFEGAQQARLRAVERCMLLAQAHGCGTGEGGDIHQDVRLQPRGGIRESVGQHHAAFGVRVADSTVVPP